MHGGADRLGAMASMAKIVGATSTPDELVHAVLDAPDVVCAFSYTLRILRVAATVVRYTQATAADERGRVAMDGFGVAAVCGFAAGGCIEVGSRTAWRRLVYAGSEWGLVVELGEVL